MSDRRELVAAARGDLPLDTAVRGVNLVNVYTGQIYPADIGIYGQHFAAVGRAGKFELGARRVIDGGGLWATPGFFDSHVHIESMMVTPPSFAEAVLRFGTTAVAIDPHEIANVLGEEGVRYMVEASRGLPVRILVCVPSCVPPVPTLESSNAEFDRDAVGRMLRWDGVVGIAEIMDYPGVIHHHDRIAGIVEEGLAQRVINEGHAPLVLGRNLMAYRAAGVVSDHESRETHEVIEKAEAGTQLHIRDSSMSHCVDAAVDAWKTMPNAINFDMCTDDIEPDDVVRRGHMNRVARLAMARGMDPATAIRYATLNGARFYRQDDIGGIAPGMQADLVLLRSLEEMDVKDVWVAGRQVVADGELIVQVASRVQPPLQNTMRLPPLRAEEFLAPAPIEEGELEAHTIEIQPNRRTILGKIRVRVSGRRMRPELPPGYNLLSVVGRHGQNEPPSHGILRGINLRSGALASTVAHDAHNLVIAGTNPEDMLLCAETLARCGGGFCLAEGGQVRALVELPVAGLMAPDPVTVVAPKVEHFNQEARKLGVSSPTTPILSVSGIALPVAPWVKITNRGLVSVDDQRFIPLFPAADVA
ncbi:MAG TPA: adenine deaminase C-terminal domain-containing protein [Chloroflexota bacterium]|nr:adenine deaminase C-terminal domain-containing protein [Chloroflexota bacterium]